MFTICFLACLSFNFNYLCGNYNRRKMFLSSNLIESRKINRMRCYFLIANNFIERPSSSLIV